MTWLNNKMLVFFYFYSKQSAAPTEIKEKGL